MIQDVESIAGYVIYREEAKDADPELPKRLVHPLGRSIPSHSLDELVALQECQIQTIEN